ncbi:hypothetical protein ACFWPV_27590 [Streptomyces uncialis]|uniref:hypothetical protein n=1 Tax=Streptomyces uncialis TaxID=1048205 RepID=UPI00364CE3E0
MTKRQRPDRVCVLPGDPAWIGAASYLEDTFRLLGRAAEVAEDRGDADRYVLTGLTYRIAECAIGRIKDEVLTPEAGRPAVHLLTVPAFELDALWKVLEVLRRAGDGEENAVGVLELIESFGQCFSPSRTAAAFITDLERVLAVLTLDIPAGRDLTAALVLDAPGLRRRRHVHTAGHGVEDRRHRAVRPHACPGGSRAFPLQGATAQPGWSVRRRPGAATGP